MLYSKKQRPDSYLYFSQYKAFLIEKTSAKLVEKVYLVRKKSVKKKYEITV